MRATTLLSIARVGSGRARRHVISAGDGARQLAAMQAGLSSGILDALAQDPATSEHLAQRLGLTRRGLLDGLLAVLAADGLIRAAKSGWRLTRLAVGLVDDDEARALCEAFDGYHSGLYRDLPAQLHGGPDRSDVVDRVEVIARSSRIFEPLIIDELTKVTSQVAPYLVLDVGCGSGSTLAHMLASAWWARAIGVDASSEAIALAARRLVEAGSAHRADLFTGDAADLIGGDQPVTPADSVDLALAIDVLCYLTTEQMRSSLAGLVRVLRPGGMFFVVTTELDDSATARHLDLLLRAQQTPLGLFPRTELVAELERVGLRVDRVRRLTPGEPLVALHAVKPGALAV